MKQFLFVWLLLIAVLQGHAQTSNYYHDPSRIYLDSKDRHNGNVTWKMYKATDVKVPTEQLSRPGFSDEAWIPAIVPGTVLTSLVYNNVYPDPQYGLNNRLSENLIPDLYDAGRDHYTYWFRTEFDVPASYKDKVVWLQVDGINYRAEIWFNGHLVGNMAGMFREDYIDVTDYAKIGEKNALAIKVLPVDMPGTTQVKKTWGARDEFHNGGDGDMGLNVTMLMGVGWDFTFMDGVRDRNTGIWKSISLYTTDKVDLRHPFIKSQLNDTYDVSHETISVEVTNAIRKPVKCTIKGEIVGEDITFEKEIDLFRQETQEVRFTPEEFRQLVICNPRLWWPVNKGKPELYELKLTAWVDGKLSDEVNTRFGIREVTSDRNTPDQSRQFYVNGKKLFVRGTNWIPDAMLLHSDERTYATLRYTRQTGVNLIRLWGGGIIESDYFYQLCDEMGFLVWQEFFMTGDTKHPHDPVLYLGNVEATVKRIRNHPSIAYYVSSNESTEMMGAKDLIMKLDGTRGYQMESECDGVHDGSPYKTVNPMRHYENTASTRGSRIDGFNPEYGAPTIPTVECLREIMDEKDLWPINRKVWDYREGEAFYEMTTLYKQMADEYGSTTSIEDFAMKGQFVGAMQTRAIWEAWNYNKLNYGDRYTSGILWWYHNSPIRQVSSYFWDYSLEPLASLYAMQSATEPLHAQFDYLKNTVSVYNDYYQSFSNYQLKAELYDLNCKRVWSKQAKVNIPEDGVVNDVFAVEFPSNLTSVHFIKLRLLDEKGKEVSSTFYWRSNNRYEGPKSVTGPTTAGFQLLNELKQVNLKSSYKKRVENGRSYISLTVENNQSTLAFFTQIQLLDADGKPVRPSFYTDNFFSLLPGERRTIEIETSVSDMPDVPQLVIKGWNVKQKRYQL